MMHPDSNDDEDASDDCGITNRNEMAAAGYQMYEGSEDSGELAEYHDEISESVREEMAKLENIFRKKGLNFRMIDRIGEGDFGSICPADKY